MRKRKQFDMRAPDAEKLRAQIVHGAFVTEGTMVAFPTCFPAVTTPLPADESFITALDIGRDGMIYVGTSGRAAHLLVGMFHGVTGMVLDLGAPADVDNAAAVCCGRKRVFAAVNGPRGGQIVIRSFQPLPFDLIQEWHIVPRPCEVVPCPAKGERLLHAVSSGDRQSVVGVSESCLYVFDFETAQTRIVGEIAGKGRLVVGPGNSVFGPDTGNTLWRFDCGKGTLERQCLALPPQFDGLDTVMWGRDTLSGALYTADGEGNLYCFSGKGQFKIVGKVPYAPVGPMAVTFDGRLFGAAGNEMSRMFCYRPATGQVSDLGVAVSTLEKRRYGYAFGDAIVGRDGEIVFGENDDLGHLWLYFPRVDPVEGPSR